MTKLTLAAGATAPQWLSSTNTQNNSPSAIRLSPLLSKIPHALTVADRIATLHPMKKTTTTPKNMHLQPRQRTDSSTQDTFNCFVEANRAPRKYRGLHRHTNSWHLLLYKAHQLSSRRLLEPNSLAAPLYVTEVKAYLPELSVPTISSLSLWKKES